MNILVETIRLFALLLILSLAVIGVAVLVIGLESDNKLTASLQAKANS